ncbi:MAG TPA: P27 family phage terminase small subunit [Rubrivivax sp.]|nr:P27 family phage terminase small subunit [Rubrivivax sp.]
MSSTGNHFGPKPAPTALKALAGNPGKRPLKVEPKPTAGAPACPDWMPEVGRQQWERVVPELDRLKLLTKVDSAVLEAFCSVYAEFVDDVKAGRRLSAASLGQLRFYAGELGLTPAARARLAAPPGQEDPQIDMFFH